MVSKVELDGATLHLGDCLEVLRTLPDCSVDAVVTDPPYGLSFMGKKWDYDVPAVEVWAECLRVLKPGGHLLAFAGTRTQHRMAVRIEDAGFEIRDMIAWVYGSGFPKSLDVSKAIDKAAGALAHEGRNMRVDGGVGTASYRRTIDSREYVRPAPATDAARQWSGWGTALKPTLEPITVARKPLAGTVAANVLEHGTGALNVDGCRVGTDGGTTRSEQAPYAESGWRTGHNKVEALNLVRWPANLIHDGSDEVVALFPSEAGSASPVHTRNVDKFRTVLGAFSGNVDEQGSTFRGDAGSAARFFYCAKASKADRDEGCDALPFRESAEMVDRDEDSPGIQSPSAGAGRKNGARNFHPTVKPTDLMRYLCRLVTPPGGTVLDPFMGSGSTGRAALLEGFRFIGIEREAQYLEIACARVQSATPALWRQS